MKYIKEYLKENKFIALFCFIIWTTALVFGIYKSATSDYIPEFAEYSGRTNFSDTLFLSVSSDFIYSLLLLVCSFFPQTIVLSILLIGFKGFSAGFVASAISELPGIRGVAITFTSMVFPYCFYMPVYLLMFTVNMRYQIMYFKNKKTKFPSEIKKQRLYHSLAILILFIFLCIISCLEAFLVPPLIRLIG